MIQIICLQTLTTETSSSLNGYTHSREGKIKMCEGEIFFREGVCNLRRRKRGSQVVSSQFIFHAYIKHDSILYINIIPIYIIIILIVYIEKKEDKTALF